jgi:general secretion pathway protein I
MDMRRAFTLLEVIVALAIFALAAVVLGAAYVNVLNAYETVARGTQTDEEVRFARAQLLAEPDHDTAEKGGNYVAPDGRQVKWTATITSTDTADLFTVTFVCELTDPAANTGTQTVTENFTVMRPTWADPTENTTLKQNAQDRIAKLQGRTNSN